MPAETPAEDAAPAAQPEPTAEGAASGPLSADEVAAIVKGYTFEATTLDLGALVNTDPVPTRKSASRSR